jgi:Transcriptional regulator PadR-like family
MLHQGYEMTKIEISGEVNAMAAIEAAFADLDEDAKGRVLRWAADRFGLVTLLNAQKTPSAIHNVTLPPKSSFEATELADLYSTAAPTTESEKALVVAYWLQFIKGQTDLESQQINSELKQLGHGIANITKALETLKDRKPQLIVQTRKEGTTQQARKKYRITDEGRKAVQHMLSSSKDQQ